eukprot:m.16056 g.16056  ORF g.16056 m.16056 type:complete len:115 (+) comp4560_c0_seq2:1449-1793(+)
MDTEVCTIAQLREKSLLSPPSNYLCLSSPSISSIAAIFRVCIYTKKNCFPTPSLLSLFLLGGERKFPNRLFSFLTESMFSSLVFFFFSTTKKKKKEKNLWLIILRCFFFFLFLK